MTAEELIAAAEHCTLCTAPHPQRTFGDHRGQQHTTDATDHARLPLDPLTAMRLRKLIPVTAPKVITRRSQPRAARPRAKKAGYGT